jgi:hypothetical protein
MSTKAKVVRSARAAIGAASTGPTVDAAKLHARSAAMRIRLGPTVAGKPIQQRASRHRPA